MSVTIYIPTPLRRLCGGAVHVTIEIEETSATFARLVDILDAQYPGMKAEVWEADHFKNYINVYLNGDEIRGLQGTSTSLHHGDQVALIPMLAGGEFESHPVGPNLSITRAAIKQMFEHARRDFPNECCGLVSGQANLASHVHEMRNVHASPVLYTMDPKEQLQVFTRIDDADEELISIYHSHTRSKAYPSPTDVRLALYPETVYLIVSLENREYPILRGFMMSEGAITEVAIEEFDEEAATCVAGNSSVNSRQPI